MVRRIELVLHQKIQRRKLAGVDYNAPKFVQPDSEAIRRYVEANRRERQKPWAARAA
jgi:hypothetical protein